MFSVDEELWWSVTLPSEEAAHLYNDSFPESPHTKPTVYKTLQRFEETGSI